MKIKGFKDGETFVLTFDGASQEFINQLIDKFRPELLAEVAAEPVIMEQREEKEKKNPAETRFEKGPLKGMTVIQSLSKRKDEAFKVLSFYVSTGKLPEEMHEHCVSCLNNYITYRFESYIGKTSREIFPEFSAKERDENNKFINIFSSLINAEMWKAVKANSACLGKLDDKQAAVLATLIVLRGAKKAEKNLRGSQQQ